MALRAFISGKNVFCCCLVIGLCHKIIVEKLVYAASLAPVEYGPLTHMNSNEEEASVEWTMLMIMMRERAHQVLKSCDRGGGRLEASKL